MKRPTISVIIPVYNAEKYLRECLDSVRNQTFKDLEIICVNDGSTDGSLDILRGLAKKDERFVVINQENQGVNIARAEGYKRAHGMYIAWVDNDDVLKKDMYEKMFNLAKKNKSEIVISNYSLYPKKIIGKEIWYKPFSGVNDWKFIARNTTLWNKIVSKELLDKVKIVDLFNNMGESAYGIVLVSSDLISTIDEPLYNYRVGHSSSVSKNYDSIEWFKTTVDSTKEKYEYARKHNFQSDIQDYFFYCYLYYSLILMSIAARNGDKKLYNDERILIRQNNLFSKKYQKFFKTNLSFTKRIFFELFICSNYNVARFMGKIVLR